jgi:hypothetical protein
MWNAAGSVGKKYPAVRRLQGIPAQENTTFRDAPCGPFYCGLFNMPFVAAPRHAGIYVNDTTWMPKRITSRARLAAQLGG